MLTIFQQRNIFIEKIGIKIHRYTRRPERRDANRVKSSRPQQEAMEQVLSVLYGGCGIAASALYVPQILKYHRDRDARMSISILAWGGWIAIAAVTILYALYVVKNYLFAGVASLNVIAQVTVLFYGISARLSTRTAAPNLR
jgi:hypothetical protein